MTNTANNGCALCGQECHAGNCGAKDRLKTTEIDQIFYRWALAAMFPRVIESPTQGRLLQLLGHWMTKLDVYCWSVEPYSYSITEKGNETALIFELWEGEEEGCQAFNPENVAKAEKYAATIAKLFNQEVRYEVIDMEIRPDPYDGCDTDDGPISHVNLHRWTAAIVLTYADCLDLADTVKVERPLFTLDHIETVQSAPMESVRYTVSGDATERTQWIGGSDMWKPGAWRLQGPDGSYWMLDSTNEEFRIRKLMKDLEIQVEVYGPTLKGSEWIYRAMFRAGICPMRR